jgi:lysophospholipase L1-like esterase
MGRLRRIFLPALLTQQYWQQIKVLFGSSLIAYWPLNDASATVATDASGNGHDGVIEGATPGVHPLDGMGRYGFDGINDDGVLYSAGLASAFNVSEGMVSVWFKMLTAADWENATIRMISWIGGTDYEVSIYKDAETNYILMKITQNGITKQHVIWGYAGAGWQNLAITWSVANNRNRFYRNGKLMSEQVVTQHTGTITGWRIGELAGWLWKGGIGSIILTDREPTEAEMVAVASEIKIYRMSVLGDSISAGTVGEWALGVLKLWRDGEVNLYNHAVTGHTIISNMDAQVTAAASDNADIIIIALGTNDDNAGNMAALQAEVEENIAELKVSNPNAKVYWMNVLPQWTDTGGGTPIDKSNIRTAITAACTAQGITCWDTFAAPWITAGQTSDGVHPNTAGHAAIAAQILARI